MRVQIATGKARDVHLPALRPLYQDYFTCNRVAARVIPATMVPPPLIVEEVTGSIQGRNLPSDTAIARNIAPGSTAGIPGLALPAGMTSAGLPIGIEFDAPAASARSPLALGLSIHGVPGPIQPPRI